MNHNQLPNCDCHDQLPLLYFYRETVNKKRKHLITSCQTCGEVGNQAVKNTPEMMPEWREKLPVLDFHDYQDWHYWNYDEPRSYPIGYPLELTREQEIAETENSEAEYLAAGTGEFAIWHFDPELGADE